MILVETTLFKAFKIPVLFFLGMLYLGLTGCGNDDSIPQISGDPYIDLPSYSFTVEALELQTAVEDGIQSFVELDVSVHEFFYETNYDGETLMTSGALAIPINPAEPPSLFSFHHGTFIDPALSLSEIPKILFPKDYLVPASNGYITLFPDYIGYGETNGHLHPYIQREPSATTVINMILAAREFLETNNISFDQKLFLGGFSEGGYVTMAVHRELELNDHGLQVTASAPGAGPYNIRFTLDEILTSNSYSSPELIGFFLASYNKNFLNRPLTDYFQEPSATIVDNFFINRSSSFFSLQQLPSQIDELLNPTFLEDFRGNGELPLKQIIQDNNLVDWVPQTPITFFHGSSDNTVPSEVSQHTFDRLLELGTDPDLIDLEFYPGGHDQDPWLELTLEWFSTFRNN